MIGPDTRPLRFSCGVVRQSPRQVIYAIRVHDVLLDLHEIEDVTARMCELLAHRGESSADVVMVQGDAKETLRLFGTPYSVNRVRAAMFSAAIRWTPIELD
ncbi:MAG TPA: hypothetical protein VHQ92_06595 [Pseudolabrys sp.]|nr:hypothetical protein [Pseudolabrys sp.]